MIKMLVKRAEDKDKKLYVPELIINLKNYHDEEDKLLDEFLDKLNELSEDFYIFVKR